MSEAVTAPMGPAGAVQSPLRVLREQAGLELVALAAMLKVAPQKLEALEAGRYHELPDMTFARALAKSVCRALKVDSSEVLVHLPASPGVVIKEANEGLNAPFPMKSVGATGKVVHTVPVWAVSKPVWMTVLLLSAALGLWFLLPQLTGESSFMSETQPPAALELAAVESAPPFPRSPPSSDLPALTEVAAPVTALPPPVAAEPALPAPPVHDAAALSVSAEETVVAPLQIRALESSWVQVTASSGRVLLQRQLSAGEVVVLSEGLPLAVVVGRADATEVSVRGVTFDTRPFVRNNVARFEVK